MPEQTLTEVEIFCRTYTLVSEHDAVYAKGVAASVDRRMARVASEQNLADTGKIAIMTALEIADEIISCRDRSSSYAEAAEAGCQRLTQSIDEADSGT